jgi:hypothetical protein
MQLTHPNRRTVLAALGAAAAAAADPLPCKARFTGSARRSLNWAACH